ncbi:hypothetical protein Sp245p_17230 (plasmid) [Azospirillum baldaniorum]|uniref:Uncharacterized protein n=1 Tax=Azospirillum baldaniorum TaxID=1064539 RepID=A0A9P1JUH2_9PROT|nr:hypothetical protein [Azospirillum baldaniorum]AWJ91578.1 hypothetical protein Sp245p_17230 [Azospirillum baldaniorum]TWA70879.1 hypothetical protein FBZ84_102431 [Azospirillum baldaniorum]TWA83557.1 hypothetical protein FBZ85_101304 [Azospirillum brasilense]CCC99902.1 protein of unknown function [Azospirillum baldaniorum]
MLRLGTRVRFAGQEALVVARTLAGEPTYDIRLADGRLIKYAAESDLEPIEGDGSAPPPASARPSGDGGSNQGGMQ